MKPWERDKAWSDRFIPEIMQIVGPKLLIPSPLEVDQKEAADLIVLRARDLSIACRIRRNSYITFKDEFTIRSQRDTGLKTELEKIVEGWGDWMFYGFSDATETRLAYWTLIDLDAWRAHLIREKLDGARKIIRGNKPNGDGTHFSWFRIDSFVGEPNLVLANSIIEMQPF